MTEGSFRKASLGSLAALETIPSDVWVYAVMPSLTAAEILPLRAVSTQWRGFVMTDDVWLNKLTMLSLQYPSLLHLEQATDESVFAWFWRCMSAVGTGLDLARRHARGDYPYLQLYGAVTGTSFTPYAEMRFQVELGVIAELIDIMSRSGKFADPAFDATLVFQGSGAQLDAQFRRFHSTVKEARRRTSKPAELERLADLLGKQYAPRAVVAAPSSSADAPPTARTAPAPRDADAPKLQLRLRRMSAELTRANERIAALEAENARLRVENAGLRA